MSENEVIKDLQTAFQNIDQRVQSDPAENFEASVCQQLLEDFYLFNSLDKAYYLPKILIGWINNHSNPSSAVCPEGEKIFSGEEGNQLRVAEVDFG